MSLETQIFNLSPYCYSFCCPKLLIIQNGPLPLLMVDMDDDFVTERLVIFTEALDDLVVSWVVEFGSTVAVADAFVDAVIGVPVVDVPSLDSVLLTTDIVDAVVTFTK